VARIPTKTQNLFALRAGRPNVELEDHELLQTAFVCRGKKKLVPMSVRATNFVRALRGLSPSEKAVAFVLADHDNHKGSGTYPSMTTVAEEAGLQNRETASRITQRLVLSKIIGTENGSDGSKGRKSTVYRFNYDLANRDCGVTVENQPTVTPESRFEKSNRDSTPPPTVTLQGPNRDSPVTRRVEGLREGVNLRPLTRPSTPACGNVGSETTAAPTCALLALARSSPVEDAAALDQRRRLLADQARMIQENYKTSCSRKDKDRGRRKKRAAATPQQRRFAIIGRLADRAVEILNRKPHCELGDLAEELKQWAAQNGVPYFDAWPGAATPIQQAITIATERRKTA